MRKEIIETKLDGSVPFEFWDKKDFAGRVTRLISEEGVESMPIPDDAIVCDFCNASIKEFPVPVFGGTHALCPECYKNVKAGD